MRGFVALLRREAREARNAAVLGVAGASVALAAVFHVGSPWSEPRLLALALVPALVALFAAAAASDLVAGDVVTRRIETLAVLPAPLASVWNAKALVLAATTCGGAAAIVVVAWAFLRVSPANAESAQRFLDALPSAAPHFAFAVCLGAATLFFSTLLERGFVAVFAAAALLAVLGVAVELAALPYASDAQSHALRIALPLGVAAALVAASRFAFVNGGLHMGRKLGPALVALGTAAALLAPEAAAVAAFAGPGAPAERATVVASVPSPNGKWTAVEERRGDACAVFLVDVAGNRRLAALGHAELPARHVWGPESNLRVVVSSFSLLFLDRRQEVLTLEPTRLGVVERMRASRDRGDLRERR